MCVKPPVHRGWSRTKGKARDAKAPTLWRKELLYAYTSIMASKHQSEKSGSLAARTRVFRVTMKLALLGGVALSVAGGCGDDFSGAEVVCHKGDTRECLGPGACKGAQECTATGSGFQPCQCGDGAAHGGDGGQGSSPEATSGASTGGNSTTPGGAPGAGGTGESATGGTMSEGGAGGAGGSAPQYECSPFDNEGCTASQNCSLDTGEAACVSAGTKTQLAACTTTSECAPGLLCQFRNCVKVCSTTEDCTVASASLKCGLGRGYPEFALVGSCVKACDVLTQDCPAGQGCYLGSCLTAVSAGAQGGYCDWGTECAKGLDCLGDSDGDSVPNCNKYCSTTAQNPCGQGFVCYPLAEAFPGVPAAWGICAVEQ